MARKKDGKPRMFIPPVEEPTTDDERDALGLPDAKAQMYARAAAREDSERAPESAHPGAPLSDLVRRWFFEPKTEPSPEIPEEVRERQARFYEWMTRQGIELTEGQKAAFESRAPIPRLHECELEDCPATELVGRHTAHPRPYTAAEKEQTAAEALRAIRERQGRPLHEARPLSLVPDTLPRIEVAKPDLQQVLLTEAEEAYLERARRQQERLNEQIRAAKEAAWDEGREMGGRSPFFQTPNPYRKAD